MKIIVDYPTPFALAHGGAQTLIQSLITEARSLGMDIEPERWWDEKQKGDVLHFFGRPQESHLDLAIAKGYRTVMTEFLDATASRPRPTLLMQYATQKLARAVMPGWTSRMGWGVYRKLNALVYVTELEADVASFLFGAPRERMHIIPHGLPTGDLEELSRPAPEEDYLISLATIHPRKNTLLLARAAAMAQVPVRFVGRPYDETDSYYVTFKEALDPAYTRHEGYVSREHKFELLRRARGFVLLSQMESGCFALYEAAAAGLPLLLSNLPWANQVYNNNPNITFTDLGSEHSIAERLHRFYAGAHRQDRPTFFVSSWTDIARRYITIYKELYAS